MNAQPKPLIQTNTPSQFIDGNQAIALAALDAGVNYVSHYPGSPVNRVIPEIQKSATRSIIINHALNEHIAALSAMGASLSGARSLVVMKHVGLNIAADPLNYAGVARIKAGMVVVVGTDPGARTSTGEEDVHWYAPQFNFPLLEPVSIQRIYDTVRQAFDISEQVQTPVLVFVPGRLAYQTTVIQRKTAQHINGKYHFHKDPETLINVGARAVRNHREHIERIQQYATQPTPVTTDFNDQAKIGIITRGATYAVVHEVIRDLQLHERVHLLNIEQTYPLHSDVIIAFATNKTSLTVIEDQDGFLETLLKREAFGKIQCSVNGKNLFPAWGEISYEQIQHYFIDAFTLTSPTANTPVITDIEAPERPGTFCEGCPHRAAFYAIDSCFKENNGIIGGDIGCSSLPPHRTDWLLCMNAGIGMAQGIAQLLPEQALVSSGGEGSLFHGGLTSLHSAVENNINLTHVLFDNASIAMTGHQDSPTTHAHVDIPKLLEAIGVRYVFEVSAFETDAVSKAITTASKIHGVKVIWIRGNCALLPTDEMLQRRKHRSLHIDPTRCAACTLCYDALQCPAIIKNTALNRFEIDLQSCRRCAACISVCPNDAIIVTDTRLEVDYA